MFAVIYNSRMRNPNPSMPLAFMRFTLSDPNFPTEPAFRALAQWSQGMLNLPAPGARKTQLIHARHVLLRYARVFHGVELTQQTEKQELRARNEAWDLFGQYHLYKKIVFACLYSGDPDYITKMAQLLLDPEYSKAREIRAAGEPSRITLTEIAEFASDDYLRQRMMYSIPPITPPPGVILGWSGS